MEIKIGKLKFGWMDFLFAGVILALALACFFPGTASITASLNDGAQISSVSGFFHGEAVLPKEGRLQLPDEITEDDTISVVHTEEMYRMTAWWQEFWAGLLSGNPQDGEYYSRIILDAFLEERDVFYPENDYLHEMSIPEMLDTYGRRYLILFALRGGSTDGWDEEMQEAAERFGFEEGAFEVPEDGSLVGYMYAGKAGTDTGEDAIARNVKLTEDAVYVMSAGVHDGNRTVIRINGQDYSADANGLNVVVYDPDHGTLIDSISYNINSDHVRMSRNDDLFTVGFRSVYNYHLCEYIHAAARICRDVFRSVCILLAAAAAVLWLQLRLHSRMRSQGRKPTAFMTVLGCVPVFVLFVLFALMKEGYSYLVKSFKGVTADQLLFHLTTNLEGANWKMFSDLYEHCSQTVMYSLLAGLGVLAVCLLVRKLLKKYRYTDLVIIAVQWAAVCTGAYLIFAQAKVFWKNYHINDYFVSLEFDTELYDTVYTAPENVRVSFPAQKKNLIYIFMESMEISVADEQSGGGKSFNAIPELTDLAMEYDCFNGEEETLNGAVPLYNSTWTIAGMVAQSSGIPLGINHYQSNTKGSIASFLPGAVTLGDILEQNGYRNEVMMGSDAKFGNRDSYYSAHGNAEIYDYKYAMKTGLIPEDYKVFWGMEDAKLVEAAKQEARRLAGSEEPFCLSILTVDTHFPSGYLCEDCGDELPDKYANVFACSSKRVAEYVSWIQSQPWGKDTVIILNGDHLCMNSSYFEDMPVDYERKTFTAVINSQKEEPSEKRYYSTMDLFPTTLSAMGCTIEGDRLGFGTDLYSSKPTLLEEKGKGYLNYQLSLNSDYYRENIMYE
ncbi:MAG: sulfatase-like hydrolase/transferase [Solobacterium sp.]|nr:sulfatase-like hydrolase/transferase [Solobacterium sp.]